MKVLLATDGSEHAEAAVNEIIRQRFPANSAVLIISVAEPPYLPLTYPGDGVDMDVYSQIEKDGLEHQEGSQSGRRQPKSMAGSKATSYTLLLKFSRARQSKRSLKRPKNSMRI